MSEIQIIDFLKEIKEMQIDFEKNYYKNAYEILEQNQKIIALLEKLLKVLE